MDSHQKVFNSNRVIASAWRMLASGNSVRIYVTICSIAIKILRGSFGWMECTLKDRLSGVATSRQKCFCLHKILTKKPIPSSLLNEAEISRDHKRTV